LRIARLRGTTDPQPSTVVALRQQGGSVLRR
jgi:hypothetical protein